MQSPDWIRARHPHVRLTPEGRLSKHQTGYFVRRCHEPDGGYLGRIFNTPCDESVMAVFTDYGTYVIGFPDLRSAWEHRNLVMSPGDPDRAAVLDRTEYIHVDGRIGSQVEVLLSKDVGDGTVGDIIEMFSELCPHGRIEMHDPRPYGDACDPRAVIRMWLETNSSALGTFLEDALRAAVGDRDGVLSVREITIDCALCETFPAWNGLDAFTVEMDIS